MAINKKKFYPVPDSLVEREDGHGKYYNVEARFSDHPVINPDKSRIARHNVYDFSIVLHTRVRRVMGDAAAQPNMSAQPIRFDKGKALRGDDFERCKALIMRCWEAWTAFQAFREAPVTPGEQIALHQIELLRAHRQAPGKVMVDIGGGQLVERSLDPDDEGNEEDDEEESVATVQARAEAEASRPVAPRTTKPAAKPKRKATARAA